MADITDIGAFAATALADPDRYIGEVVELAVDEQTLEGAAETFSKAFATNIEAQHVPIDAAREQMGEDLALMFEWINEYGYEADIDELERDYQIELTDLETYVSENDWTEPTGR